MRLGALKAKLDAFAAVLRPARNKMMAHNDLNTILLRPTLGEFPDGADVEYFKNLQEFMDIVAGAPRPFNDLIRNDARVFGRVAAWTTPSWRLQRSRTLMILTTTARIAASASIPRGILW